MSGPGYLFTRPFAPSAAINIYRLVKLTATDTVTQCTAVTDKPIGVALEEITAGDVTNGRQVSVALFGASRVIAGAAIAAGATVGPDAQGRAITATATNFATGMAIQSAAAAGDHVDIILNPIGVVI
jgi:predicted RecA/RadA family phage recombinase